MLQMFKRLQFSKKIKSTISDFFSSNVQFSIWRNNRQITTQHIDLCLVAEVNFFIQHLFFMNPFKIKDKGGRASSTIIMALPLKSPQTGSVKRIAEIVKSALANISALVLSTQPKLSLMTMEQLPAVRLSKRGIFNSTNNWI